ncbi:calcium-binding protein [Roseibium aggregatum]|uniref:Peptidase M10 serralysin C-terminal domain-containing protein n=1 Tax=Roseibium aggregatum TaxID=187304 RepID=A0A939EGX4_9HYPH|nr:M10 family metallopeptidase C-terminal domain-containing protein [Roseibium aggregatum]MBN9671545.1 hypothetical protein [Roseibium aggregatum]
MAIVLERQIFRLDGYSLADGNVTAGTSLTSVTLEVTESSEADAEFLAPARPLIIQGQDFSTPAEAVTFTIDGTVVATEMPEVRAVGLTTDQGRFAGVVFEVDGATYFMSRTLDTVTAGATRVTEDTLFIGQPLTTPLQTLEYGLLPQSSQQFVGQQFVESFLGTELRATSVTGAELFDADGVRDNGADSGDFTDTPTEGLATILFNDGTTGEALALREVSTFNFGSSSRQYVFETEALEALGKTIEDVARVTDFTAQSHDLTFQDLGFSLADGNGDPAPVPDPEPEPEPEPEIDPITIEGTGRNDRLVGTDADEFLFGGGGNDRLTGGEGADTFIFGADSQSGVRDRDVITDFDAGEDTIVLEAGAEILRVVERNGNAIIHLEGDGDRIVVRDADAGIVDNIVFQDDFFLV